MDERKLYIQLSVPPRYWATFSMKRAQQQKGTNSPTQCSIGFYFILTPHATCMTVGGVCSNQQKYQTRSQQTKKQQ